MSDGGPSPLPLLDEMERLIWRLRDRIEGYEIVQESHLRVIEHWRQAVSQAASSTEMTSRLLRARKAASS